MDCGAAQLPPVGVAVPLAEKYPKSPPDALYVLFSAVHAPHEMVSVVVLQLPVLSKPIAKLVAGVHDGGVFGD
jgi:hypothetical protein